MIYLVVWIKGNNVNNVPCWFYYRDIYFCCQMYIISRLFYFMYEYGIKVASHNICTMCRMYDCVRVFFFV